MTRCATLLQIGVLTALVLSRAPALSSQQVRIQDGARVVSYGSSARLPEWRINERPQLALGGADGRGPTELSAVVGVVRLSTGELVIADASSSELRVFSAHGDHVRTFGGRGGGPGEFDGLLALHRSGDTLVAIDRGQQRLQLFTVDGRLVRTVASPLFPGASMPFWAGVTGDGSGVMLALEPLRDTTAARAIATGALGVQDARSSTVRRIARFNAYEVAKSGGRQLPVYLGSVFRQAVLADRVCLGWAAAWDITCYGPAGAIVSRTLRAVTPASVSDADRSAFREGFYRANRTVPRERLEAVARVFPFAERRSAFGRFVAGVGGELWVGPFVISEDVVLGRRGAPSPDRATRWTVIGSEGQIAGEVTLPARFALLDAGADYVAGVLRDEDDVETAVVYSLARR